MHVAPALAAVAMLRLMIAILLRGQHAEHQRSKDLAGDRILRPAIYSGSTSGPGWVIP